MEVIVARSAGFCFGVRRAIEMAFRTAETKGGQAIYTLGPLIHNAQVVEELKRRGLSVADDINDVESGTIIVRTHGVAPEVREEAQKKGLELIDATCPFVGRAQKLAAELAKDGYQVIIVGDKNHPEVEAVAGSSGYTALVVSNADELRRARISARVGVIAQTTQILSNYQECVAALMERAIEIKVHQTICSATRERQHEVQELARQCPVMVVIGGRHSANTTKLAELCRREGATTYHVENAEELNPAWFQNVTKVGVTAGASTPDWIIEGVVRRMTDEFKNDQTTAEAAVTTETGTEEGEKLHAATGTTAEHPVSTESAAWDAASDAKDDGNAAPTGEETGGGAASSTVYDDTMVRIKPGQVIKAKVVQIRNDEVLVDIGYKSEGIIPREQLSSLPVDDPGKIVQVGDEIDVYVIKVEEGEGNVILSKKRADGLKSWDRLVQLKKENGTLEAVVRERVKGGLLVDVGVRGFVPASHVSREYVEDLQSFVGKKLRFKILELEEDRKNVVLSHKLVEDEEYQAAKAKAFSELEVGATVEGEVKRLTNFGAFVDIGHGVEGLLHVSEMAWSRVKHPSDVLKEGDRIRVMILGIDRENERISLGLKQTLPDPWETITEKYKVGQIVEGEVTRVVDFGAFVKLEDGIEGLVHISQLADYRVARAEDVVKVGQRVPVKILNIDTEAHRVSLSIKEAAFREENAEAKEHQREHERGKNREHHGGRADQAETGGAAGGTAGNGAGNDGATFTVGDVFNIGEMLDEKRAKSDDASDA